MISARFLVLLSLMAVPIRAAAPGTPGAINYIEGQATIDGAVLSQRSVGSAVLAPNQTLETARGRVEMLLTPGVFVRLGNNSALRMVSADLANIEIALTRGEASVEVADLVREDNIHVTLDGATATIRKPGLYMFNADTAKVNVYDGKAEVVNGDEHVNLGKGRETALNGRLHSQKFDRDRHDMLYAWSDIRSEYLAEASADSARTYVEQPYGWYGAGWYWNPWWDMYSFIPGDGIFYSPFGWGFYAPAYVVFAPYGWYGHGWHGGRHGHTYARNGRAPGFHAGPPAHFGGGFRGGGGFHGGGVAHGGGHHR